MQRLTNEAEASKGESAGKYLPTNNTSDGDLQNGTLHIGNYCAFLLNMSMDISIHN